MAYTWINVPTPVTNRHMAMLSGSARKATSTCRLPTGNHSNNVTTWERSSAGVPRRSMNAATVTTKEPASIAAAK